MTQDTTITINKTLEEMDSLLIKLFNSKLLPGLAFAVIRDGKPVYSRCFGYTNLETGTPITNDTIFRIMSISKTFTSIAVMQLWEQKKFDLDDPVNPYLKGLRVQHKDPAAPPVRIRHLLTHTSGIGELRQPLDIVLPVIGLAAEPDSRILSMPELYNGLLRPEIYPGEKWAYANHGFAILAHLVESVSNELFDQYMRNHIFEPLGMYHTDYVLSERVRSGLAQGYEWKKNEFKPYPYQRLITPGCGGIFSSVNEMEKYVAALMNGGANEHGRVLQPETLKLMMTPQFETGVFSMGLGFILEKVGDQLVAEHSGAWQDFISSMRVVPAQKLALIAFTNSSNAAPDIFTNEILHRMLGTDSPYEKPETVKVLQRPEIWPELVGSYAPKPGFLTSYNFWHTTYGEMEVYIKDGQLMLRGLKVPENKGIVLYHSDPNQTYAFTAFKDNMVTPILFQRNADSKVIGLDMGSYELFKRPQQKNFRFILLTLIRAVLSIVTSLLVARWITKRIKRHRQTV